MSHSTFLPTRTEDQQWVAYSPKARGGERCPWSLHQIPRAVSFLECGFHCPCLVHVFTCQAAYLPECMSCFNFGLTAFIFPVRKRRSHESLALLPSPGLSTKHRCCYKAVKHPTAKQLRGSKRTGWFCFFFKSSSELSAEWRCHIKMPFCTSAFP